jgi:hypothetical protein
MTTDTDLARNQSGDGAPLDDAGLVVLDAAQCRDLLAEGRIGRLVYTEGGLPMVALNEFVLDGDSILFTTRNSDKRRAAERGDVVAFEVDSLDADQRMRWIVTVAGHLSLVPAEDADTLTVHPWFPGAVAPEPIRLLIEVLHGRRVPPPHPGSPPHPARLTAARRS